MTSQLLFAVYDRQACYYLVPFAVRSYAEANRSFMEAVTTSDTPMALYPSDFDLVLIGSFDLDSGVVSPTPSGMPQVVINGLAALQAATASRERYANTLKPRFDEALDQSSGSSLSS